MPTCPGVFGTKSRTDRVAVSYRRRVTPARVTAGPGRHCDRSGPRDRAAPENQPVKIVPPVLAVLLLAACGDAPRPATSPAPPATHEPQTVWVYRNAPRPPALELPFIRILGDAEANLQWPAAGLHLDLI